MPSERSISDVPPDTIRAQLDRIVASDVLSRSKRLCSFLTFVVNAALEGREDRLKEFTLGVDVFERDESFDPSIDSIVRVEASRLRAKLREYYSGENANDTIRIEIPKGHYIPVFHPIRVPEAKRQSPPTNPVNRRKGSYVIVGLVALAAVYYLLERHVLQQRRSDTSAGTATRPATHIAEIEKSIAVLPFRNRSALADDAYFVDGVHDDILTQLNKLVFFDKIISRTSMEQYRDTIKSIPEIAQELGVAIILEGSVQRVGERVRVTAQLIDAVYDAHIWSKTYDRELSTTNIFKIQSEIAESIATALEATVSPAERLALERIPTTNLKAWELYHEAQHVRRTLGLGTRNEVAVLLERAVAIDPDFALAHVALARAYIDRYFTSERNKLHRSLARAAIDKAFELSPGMPETHIALADYYYKGFLDYERALEQLNFAIPLARGNSEAYAIRAFVKRRRGSIDEAVPDFLRAIELDPGNFSPHYVLANTLVILGRYEQSIAYYDRAMELAPKNFGLKILRAYALLGLDDNSSAIKEVTADPAFSDGSSLVEIQFRWEIAMLERDYDLAMSVIDTAPSDIVIRQTAYYPLDLMRGLTEFHLGDRGRGMPYFASAKATLEDREATTPDDPRIASALAFAHAGLGAAREAIDAATRAYELYPVSIDAVDGPLYVLNLAITHAMLGEDSAAIQKLAELLSRPSNWYARRHIIKRAPAFDRLHDDPAFQSLTIERGQPQ